VLSFPGFRKCFQIDGFWGEILVKFVLVEEALYHRPKPLPFVQMKPEAKDKLQRFIEKRSLRLVHATQIENVPSILRHGLLPKSSDKYSELPTVLTNDNYRVGHGGVCFSLGWPNTKTLAAWGPIGKFALIEIDPFILLKKPWFAFHTNSASKECLESFKDRPEMYCGPSALSSLFEVNAKTNTGRIVDRSAIGLAPSMPNDPQAELVIDVVIEPWWIESITLPTVSTVVNLQERISDIALPQLNCDPRAFAPRVDAKMWNRGERVVRSMKEQGIQ
jgi:hypothetical protein